MSYNQSMGERVGGTLKLFIRKQRFSYLKVLPIFYVAFQNKKRAKIRYLSKKLVRHRALPGEDYSHSTISFLQHRTDSPSSDDLTTSLYSSGNEKSLFHWRVIRMLLDGVESMLQGNLIQRDNVSKDKLCSDRAERSLSSRQHCTTVMGIRPGTQ